MVSPLVASSEKSPLEPVVVPLRVFFTVTLTPATGDSGGVCHPPFHNLCYRYSLLFIVFPRNKTHFSYSFQHHIECLVLVLIFMAWCCFIVDERAFAESFCHGLFQ